MVSTYKATPRNLPILLYLAPETTQVYRVRAINAIGTSDASDTASATTGTYWVSVTCISGEIYCNTHSIECSMDLSPTPIFSKI